MDKQYVLDNTIFLARHGSHAYGLNIATSDVDKKGIVCVGPEYYLGSKKFEQYEGFEDDQVRYSLHKFIMLAGNCNPNIIELLFVDESDILEIDEVGQKLMEQRDLFVTLKAKYTFTGYAMSQLKRIKAKRRWMVDPLKEQPKQQDFYREPSTEVEMSLLEKGTLFFDKKAYAAAIQDWGNYQHWLTSRNKDRKELEVKFGYDTKHGMHLYRLLKMGLEICTTGQVIVKRPDREELLGIRRGEKSYDELIEWAEDITDQIDSLYNDYKAGHKKAPIPMSIQQGKLDALSMELLIKHWERKGWLKGTLNV